MVGTNLSHYTILAELGRGGMGVVYKARDTKLDRTVAIKVLPSAALASEDDRQRFYREAKAAAQLHHPHIASVFEIDEAVPEDSNSDDVRPFIAMEFIDGETLDARIKKGPLKLSEAVRIAGEIAEALKAAHAKDIVHRDIKSANVMLDADGRAKVLDFGLAKTAQSTKLTRMGSTLGTMAYMSPEQAKGQEVDSRTDVWALGAVLYEMVSGRLPFPGDYEQAVVYSILNEDPEALTSVRTGVPMSLERVVDKCLAKSADRRYQSLSDFIADLKGVRDELDAPSQTRSRTGAPVSTSSMPAAPTSESHSAVALARRQSTGAVLGSGIALGLAAGLLAMWLFRPFGGPSTGATAGGGVMRLELTLPDALPLAFVGSAPNSVGRTELVMIPDGSTLVYAAERDGTTVLIKHEMASDAFEVLPGTEGAFNPIVSPDGEWIAFGADGELKKIRLEGGSPVPMAQFTDGEGFFWSSDGWIYFGDQQGRVMRRIPENGGQVETMISLSAGYPKGILSDGKHLIVRNARESKLQLMRVSDAQATLLPVDGGTTVLSPTGHLLYSYRGRLMTVVFDESTLTARGGAIPLIDDLRTESILMHGQFSISNTGVLAYASGVASDVAKMVWLEPGGAEVPIDQPEAAYGALSISPDGNRVAIVLNTVSGVEIQVIDLRTGIRKPLTESGPGWSPVWSSDGRKVIFAGYAGTGFALLSKNPDSAGPPDTLLVNEFQVDPYVETADGKTLVFASGGESGGRRLWAASTDSFDERTAISREGDYDWGPNLSPDGKWIAYTSITGARSEVRVQPFPPTGERWTISSEGGEEPVFLSSGKDVVYRNGSVWMIVSFATEPTFSPSAPRLYFEGPYINVAGFEYGVGPDDRFLLLRPISDAETTNRLNVVVNWFDELKRLAPVD